MQKLFPLFILSLALTQAVRAADGGVHWTYQGEHGPKHWGDLSPEFVQCRVGLNQSPIDITGAVEADLPSLVLDYQTYTTELVNNGHTGQANVEPGNFLRVGGESFELVQFHLHTPSEHQINGKQFLMELHFVHKNENGALAVVGLLVDEGEVNEETVAYTSKLPSEVDQPVPYRRQLSNLPPISSDSFSYYRYNGSLTTPPCTEGVRWYILKDTVFSDRAQQSIYQRLIGDDARGPQPINARVILQ